MAEEQELVQLELLCKQLYETSDTTIRSEAEKTLVQFSNSPDCLSKCQLLLERGDSPYAQLLAATTVTKLISRPSVTLPLEQRIDIRNYVLNYLGARPKLTNFVSQALVQLFTRITKQGWFDSHKGEFVFRSVTNDVGQFLNSGVTRLVMIGVQLLAQLIAEMNQISEQVPLVEFYGRNLGMCCPSSPLRHHNQANCVTAEARRSVTKHRKVSSSFRDAELFKIFQIGCDLLKKASDAIKTIVFSDVDQHGLLSHTLRLVLNCLTFDFIGTASDESQEDNVTVQIPAGWREAFLGGDTLNLFFDLYNNLPPSLSPMAMSSLVQLASVRRTLLHNNERQTFLNQLVQGVKNILENSQSLSDPNNYHEFCRLLARLKSTFQLGELVQVENYPQIIKLIAEFTVTSLQMWQFAPNSIHYLLSLWQRMVASIPYIKSSEPHLLETYAPEVTKAFITSRLDAVPVILRDSLEDPLEDQGLLSQQLDQLSTIGRCEYEKTCSLLVQLFDESAQQYQEILSSGQNNVQLAIQEGRLTWLVYIIGSVIGGRMSFSTTDAHDAMDGELVCRILQLMNLTDSRLTQGGCEKLDLAMLSFCEHFRKIYVGDQVHKASKMKAFLLNNHKGQKSLQVYRRLSDVLGLHDDACVLSVFIGKIITNLKYWGRSEPIITKTLHLLNDLSVGYSCVRKLVGLEAVQFMLSNHTSEHFPFLGVTNNGNQMNETRCRTTFYTALGRLLMVDLGEDEERFENFMMPLTVSFDALTPILNDSSVFPSEEAKRQLIGLARDLRGITFAFNNKVSYMMLFDWLYPAYTPILIRALEIWYHDPAVTTPILKLFAELAQNRSQRLQFDVGSPNGILLFKEISKVTVGYGTRILTLGNIPKDQLYPMKLKGISICFSMLKAGLSGNYVNFGVFRLYGDDAFENALNVFVKLLLSIPQSDLLEYPKLSQTYYALLECLAQDHMMFISNLEPQVFLYILSTISEGLSALDTMVCTGCCSSLDNIITYLFKRLTKKQKKRHINHPQDSEAFLRILEVHPEIWQQMLSTVLNIIMFEDCRNQWSMSRPLLGLILLNEEYFNKLRDNIISGQPAEKQAAMAQCFKTLMENIDRTLLTKNRDSFTQNLSIFRRDVNDSLKGPSSNSLVLNDMMS